MKRLFMFVALLALVATVAPAQELTTGTLEGTVVAEDGTAIAEAVVTAMGPQGVRTSVTGDDGKYVIRGLISGNYQVKAEASGFSTVVQSDVQIYINRRVQLPFQLSAGITEQVTVTSSAALVDMKSTSTGAQVRIDDFAEYVPLGRNLTSIMGVAPGVSDGGTLGNTNPSISGSSGLENAYFVDGVNITNSGYGAIGAYSIVYGSLGSGVTYDFLEEVQVKTGGFEAEYGQAGGGVVSTVVRSGSNDLGFDVGWYEEPGSLEGKYGQRLDAPNIANVEETLRRDITLSVGGPIMKDKLFFFAAYNPVTTEADYRLTSGDGSTLYCPGGDSDGDGACTAADASATTYAVGQSITGGRLGGAVTRERTIDNYAGKVSWFATPNHRIEVTAFGDPSEGDVGPQAPTSFMRALIDPINNPDATTSATGLDYGGDQYSIKYQAVWTPNFFTEVQYTNKQNEFFESGPGTTFRSIFDATTNNTIGGAGFFEGTEDEVDAYKFKNTHVFGPVELSYGYQSEEIAWAQPRRYSGDPYTAYFPNLVEDFDFDGDGTNDVTFNAACADGTVVTDPSCYTPLVSSTGASIDFDGSQYNVTRTEFIPASDATDAQEDNAFVQATWDVTPSVTVKAGLRWTRQELTGAGSTTLPIGTLSTGQAVGGLSTSLVAQTYEFDGEIAPRLGVTWDVMKDGRHKLYANYGEYYQRVPSDLAVRAFSNEVGTTGELFNDQALMMPDLTSSCFLSDGTPTNCHLVTQVQGLAGGGSIILDGTQLTPGSTVNSFLGSNADLVGAGATKLPYTEENLVGYAWEVNDNSSIEFRYIQRQIGRALEDIQFTSNEQTWNLFFGPSGGNTIALADPFPGHGAGAFGAYVFANVGDNASTALFPIPTRDYDALEFVYNRRFSDGWMAYVNYRWAELEGNYEGSFRNDNGQSDPFLTSLFDFPQASAVDSDGDGVFESFIQSDTLIGQYESGPLNTDRTHIINGFVSKQFDFGLNLGGRMNIRSGQPQGPLFAHPAYRNAGEIPGFNPVYWWGVDVDTDGDGVFDAEAFYQAANSESTAPVGASIDVDGDGVSDGTIVDHNGELAAGTGDGFWTGPRLFSYDVVKRDFFGRTPTLITFDIKGSYDLDLRGGSKLTFLIDVFNLFNTNDSTGFDVNVENRPGSPNVDFLKANSFQAPRSARIGVKYSF